MALQKDILEIERKHMAEGPHGTIYLFPEGTFYRAYELAIGCCRRPSTKDTHTIPRRGNYKSEIPK